MCDQKAVNLLWNCSNALTSDTHVERMLKSYYITTCRQLAKHNAQLPDDTFGTARMCQRCGNQWKDGEYNLHLRSQRLADTAQRRKLIAKLDNAKTKQTKGALTKGQRNRAKWLKKRIGSKMQINCGVCKNKTLLPLEKPKKGPKPKTKQTVVVTQTSAKAGSTTENKEKKKNNPNIVHKLPQRKNDETKAIHPLKKQQNVPAASPTNSKKHKKKTKPTQATPAKGTPKIQSKTQKQNALLQLAAQLKSQASKDVSKSQQNRLNAFLQ